MKKLLPFSVSVSIVLTLAVRPREAAAQSAASQATRSSLVRVSTPQPGIPSERPAQQQAEQQKDSSGGRMTLDELQQIALRNNPTLGQSRAGVKAAQGLTRQAGLWPNPTIGYVGEEIRGGSFGGGQQGVFVQQDVILGGKLGLDRKIRGEESKQAEAEVEEQKLRVENGVRVAFYESLAAQQMVEMRKQLNALARDAAETTKQLFNVGQADQPDVLQAQVEADEADVAVITAEQEQERAWRVLAAVVGKPELPLTPLVGDLEDLPTIDRDQTVQTILSSSPMKIAQLGATRAAVEVTRSEREIVPDLSLRTGYMNNLEQLGSVPPK